MDLDDSKILHLPQVRAPGRDGEEGPPRGPLPLQILRTLPLNALLSNHHPIVNSILP